MKFPDQIHDGGKGGGAECSIAIERVSDIHGYVDQAIAHLSEANMRSNRPYLRAGALRQGWEDLETIIRYVRCAQGYLKAFAGLE